MYVYVSVCVRVCICMGVRLYVVSAWGIIDPSRPADDEPLTQQAIFCYRF